LGEVPAQFSLELEMMPAEVFRGDTLTVGLIPSEPLTAEWDYEYKFRITNQGYAFDQGREIFYSSTDSTSVDSVYARVYVGESWPLETFEVQAQAFSIYSNWAEVTDSFTVTEPSDLSVLVSEDKVFFLPSPAVHRDIGYVYYDLNYDALVTLEIFNARGKQLEYYEIEGGEMVEAGSKKTIEVDISGLGSDVYIFVLVIEAELDNQGNPVNDDIAENVDKSEYWKKVVKPFVAVR
jgi:hypothetical protein